MTATTTRSDQEADGEVVTSWTDAPTRTIAVGDVDFAERFVARTLAFLGATS